MLHRHLDRGRVGKVNIGPAIPVVIDEHVLHRSWIPECTSSRENKHGETEFRPFLQCPRVAAPDGPVQASVFSPAGGGGATSCPAWPCPGIRNNATNKK